MALQTGEPRTLAEKIWDDHIVVSGGGCAPDLIYIDLHLVHEVTSPQAFDGLRLAGRRVRRPELTLATEDHNVPTVDIDQPIADPVSRTQVETLRRNCAEFGIRLHSMGDIEQGIVHVVGPQLGLPQPGMTIVCGDSHTSTHGAFGALAMGIGTSEVEHVLATQTLPLRPFKTMAVNVDGRLPDGVSAKDIILALIAKIGTGGGQGHVIEYRGSAIESLSMEGRMTICNMSIEAGARAGMVAPDETTYAFLRGRPHAPTGAQWDTALVYWQRLRTDVGAVSTPRCIDAASLSPFVTWGTNPGAKGTAGGRGARSATDDRRRRAAGRRESIGVHGPSTRNRDARHRGRRRVRRVVTNGRIEDLRVVAEVLRGRKVADGVRMLIVPGSMRVRAQAEAKRSVRSSPTRAQWRQAGC
ncbi:3-isopropylmalate dehydratase large subunit [Mycobacterium tuberculosis]